MVWQLTMTRRHTGRRGGGVCGLLASPPWLGLIITAFTKSMIDWSGIGPISHTPLHIAQSQQERRGGGERMKGSRLKCIRCRRRAASRKGAKRNGNDEVGMGCRVGNQRALRVLDLRAGR